MSGRSRFWMSARLETTPWLTKNFAGEALDTSVSCGLGDLGNGARREGSGRMVAQTAARRKTESRGHAALLARGAPGVCNRPNDGTATRGSSVVLHMARAVRVLCTPAVQNDERRALCIPRFTCSFVTLHTPCAYRSSPADAVGGTRRPREPPRAPGAFRTPAYHPLMLLAVDIGNTNVTIGLVRAGTLVATRRAATQPTATG